MKIKTKNTNRHDIIVIFLLMILIGAVVSETRAQVGVICDFPSVCQPVFEFKKWDLPFSTGRKAEFEVGETAESNEFYAVVLTSEPFTKGDACRNVSEPKRLAAQKLFPKNKVFASHYCDFDNVMYYGGVTDGYNFMAVHAGESEAAAKKILTAAKKKYAGANIRKMTARLDFSDE